MSWPPSATWRRRPAAAAAVRMTCCAAALGRVWDCWSKLTVAKATVLFLLIWPAPAALNGLATARTWGRTATCWSIRCALALTAGSRSVPDVACRTIWSELPEAAGKSCCSRLSARPDWVSGSWNWVEKLVPAAWLAPKDPARATSHKASTIVRWREHHLAMTLTLRRPFISGLPERLNDLNGLRRAPGGPLCGPGLLELSGRSAGPPGSPVMIWLRVRDVQAEHEQLAAARRGAGRRR